MGRRAAVLLCLCAFGCDEGGDGAGFETTTTPSTKAKGGFSSDLSNQIGSGSGSGSTVATNDKQGSGAKPDDTKGSDAGSDAKGSAEAKGSGDAQGSAAVAEVKGTDAKGSDAKGSAAVAEVKGTDAKATEPKGTDAKATEPKGTDAKATEPKGTDAKGTPAVAVKGPPPIDTAKPRVYVKPPPEIGAIKLSLLPNWDRDYGEPGTISLVVKVPGTDKTQVFAFRYGYEDPKAPSDRAAYKKWLAENGILKEPPNGVVIDRQRGSTWYLEGVDGSGSPVFRNIVVYGGKKLICGGSLYRDAAHNQLGDIRDKTIIQAKEICGDLGL